MNNYLTDKSNSFDDLLVNYTPGDTLFPIVYIQSKLYQDEFFTSFYLNSHLAAINGVRFENDRLFINDTPEDNHTNRQLLLDNVGIDCRTYYVQNDKKSRCFFFSNFAVEAFLEHYYRGKVTEKQRNNLVGVVSLHHEGYKEALMVMLVRSPFICLGLNYSDIAWSPKYTSLKYIGKRTLRMLIINHLCNLYLSKHINAPLYSPDINTSDEQRALTELENQYYTLPEEIKNLYTLLPTNHSFINNTEYSKAFRINLVSKYVRNLFNLLKTQKGVGLASQYLKEYYFLSIDEFIEKAYNRIMGTPEFSFNNSITDTELMDLCVDLYFLNRIFAHILKARRVISRWLYILLYRARNEVLCSQRDFIDAMMVNTIAFNASQFDSMLNSIKDTRIKTRFYTMSWAGTEDRFATSEIAFFFNGGEQPIINRLSDAERELLNDRGEFSYDTTFQQMIAYMHGCVGHTMGAIEQLRETYAKLLYELLLQQTSIQPYFGFVEYEQMW